MALVATGFEGTVTESDLAEMAPHFGPPVVEGPTDFAVTAVSGLDRTVSVAAGFADAHFVRVQNTAAANKQSGSLGSGTRWDTVVLRRDWTPPGGGTVSLEVVAGTSTQAVAAGVNSNPGNVHDQPLALVQITAGVQAPTAVVDLRRWGPGGIYAKSLLAFHNPTLGQLAIVDGVQYLRVLDSGGSAVWSTDQRTLIHGMRSTADNFAGTTFGTLASVTVPASAPAGVYRVDVRARAAGPSSAPIIGNLRVTAGLTNLSSDVRLDMVSGVADGSWSGTFTHTGSAATSVSAAYRSSAEGNTVALPGSSVTVTRL